MRPSSLHYFPLAWPFLLLLAVFLILAVALLELRLLRYVYEKIGLSHRAASAVLLLTLLGSFVNIPVAQLPPEQMAPAGEVESSGMHYIIPESPGVPGTIIAVNVGGALIPTFVSFYLLIKNRLYVRGLLGVAVVAAVVHLLARPVKGLGISVPVFIPPLVSAGVALILSWRRAPPLAYIAGSLGTLLGADLLNLYRVQGLGAPVASIGGAGTFDGVFLSGILAVLLTPLSEPIVPDPNAGLGPDFPPRSPRLA